ncbi:CRE-NLP-12 protein [Ditylenchus destructor]|nr:CRE-NLP-12 protein [Ditylenchus destructor]
MLPEASASSLASVSISAISPKRSVTFSQCSLFLMLVVLAVGLTLVSASDNQDVDKMFSREDRGDYRPLQFGKRDSTFRPLQFGKKNNYRPLQFGKRAGNTDAVVVESVSPGSLPPSLHHRQMQLQMAARRLLGSNSDNYFSFFPNSDTHRRLYGAY